MGRNDHKGREALPPVVVWDSPTISHTHEEISYDNLDNL